MSWIEEQYKGTQQTGSDGRIGGKGLGAFFWQQFVDEDKINRSSQKDLNTQTAIGLGEDITDLKGITDSSSALDVKGAAIRRGRERTSETKTEDLNNQLRVQTQGQVPQMAGIQATLQQGNQQHQATMKGMENSNNLAIAGLTQSNNQFMAQMADSKDQRALELQMRREDMDRLDRKDERNRRRDSIAALTSGLAALGAAFAL